MNRQEARSKAEALVAEMSVEEMASQLRYDAPAIERLGIPAYNWWNEALHGVARGGTATVFPQAIGLGASFDRKLLFSVGRAAGLEARAKYQAESAEGDRDIYKGITMWSPNVNLFRDPRWGRGQETYGEDPELIGKLAVSFIHGLQGDLPKDPDGAPEDAEDLRGKEGYLLTAACAKHFAVHSGPEAVRHSFNAECSEKDLRETYIPQFEDCVRDADVEAVMGAYNRTNGDACCAHPYLMQEVLRGEWAFEGHFVSDCWALRDLHEQHGVSGSAEETAVMALKAGCDLNCGCVYQNIMDAYRTWDLPESYIRESCIRLFTTRFLLGMFDEDAYEGLSYDVIDSPVHRKLSYEAALAGIVLLKNNGVLPLRKKELSSIAVIGPNADDRNSLCGNYHGTASRYVTVLEGIEDFCGDEIRVRYAKGCHKFIDREEPLAEADDRIAEAVACVKHSDLSVLVLGLDETLEGEEGDTGNAYASGDKEDLRLPVSQRRLLQAVAAVSEELGKELIVINMSGSAMDLSYADEHAGAVLQAFYPGAYGGKAMADILFGREEAKGRLPVTFYRDLEGLPAFEDYGMKGRTYRYIEKEPLYPFGYGLAYGALAIEEIRLPEMLQSADIEVLSAESKTAEAAEISVRLRNAGERSSSEVIQIYLQTEGTELESRNPHLAAFMPVTLDSGEERTVSLKLPARAFTVVDEAGQRICLPGKVSVYAGFGQPDARTKELRGESTVRREITIL